MSAPFTFEQRKQVFIHYCDTWKRGCVFLICFLRGVPSVCRYSPKNPSLVSETVHYKRGVSQQFSMPSFKIDFSEWKEEDVSNLIMATCTDTPVLLRATL